MLILNNAQKRRVTSSLFLSVAVGAVLSVAAPLLFPCPVERRAFSEEDGERSKRKRGEDGGADLRAAESAEPMRRVEVVVRGRNSAGLRTAAAIRDYPSRARAVAVPETRPAGAEADKDPDEALVDEPSTAVPAGSLR
ncbi:MAG: hypothetical protein BJ554DRAFT_6276 [Olpidium bornovanus]|uniref:Uncharacterized protein n=1 Tax=Olpidium bornovanus TaxID=278681 RepID=A0A8H8DK45_9FUNG|nr:MAG: hypothetical protein BJ554DRAFT_6276 [Olpidium bornovanus]